MSETRFGGKGASSRANGAPTGFQPTRKKSKAIPIQKRHHHHRTAEIEDPFTPTPSVESKSTPNVLSSVGSPHVVTRSVGFSPSVAPAAELKPSPSASAPKVEIKPKEEKELLLLQTNLILQASKASNCRSELKSALSSMAKTTSEFYSAEKLSGYSAPTRVVARQHLESLDTFESELNQSATTVVGLIREKDFIKSLKDKLFHVMEDMGINYSSNCNSLKNLDVRLKTALGRAQRTLFWKNYFDPDNHGKKDQSIFQMVQDCKLIIELCKSPDTLLIAMNLKTKGVESYQGELSSSPAEDISALTAKLAEVGRMAIASLSISLNATAKSLKVDAYLDPAQQFIVHPLLDIAVAREAAFVTAHTALLSDPASQKNANTLMANLNKRVDLVNICILEINKVPAAFEQKSQAAFDEVETKVAGYEADAKALETKLADASKNLNTDAVLPDVRLTNYNVVLADADKFLKGRSDQEAKAAEVKVDGINEFFTDSFSEKIKKDFKELQSTYAGSKFNTEQLISWENRIAVSQSKLRTSLRVAGSANANVLLRLNNQILHAKQMQYLNRLTSAIGIVVSPENIRGLWKKEAWLSGHKVHIDGQTKPVKVPEGIKDTFEHKTELDFISQKASNKSGKKPVFRGTHTTHKVYQVLGGLAQLKTAINAAKTLEEFKAKQPALESEVGNFVKSLREVPGLVGFEVVADVKEGQRRRGPGLS